MMKCPKCQHENPPESTYCGKCATRLDQFRSAEPGKPHPAFTETLEESRGELTTGSTFAGRYQVIEELGHGGMGRIYKVHDIKVGEKIALKLIRPEAGLDSRTLERFSNELKLARKIRHRNVCQMFDLGEDRGTRYITMEYVAGQDLRGLVRQTGHLTAGKAVSIARQVCEGLAEAHRLGVVHRDLKPSNIMIDREGNARIMDFGIARSLSAKSITGAGTLVGTPEYMSPEQVEGKDVDARSDIYSLGVILYEMVAGRRPFDGDTALAIAHKHKYEAPEDPRTADPQVPERLAQVILKCLAKDKAARYESAGALDADLARIEEGLTTVAKAPETRLGTTASGTTGWQASVVVLPFANMSADPEQDYFCDGMAEEIINALTQVEGLRIVARTSAFSFKGKNLDVREIGRQLDVEAVLEGSVRRAGNRLRITAQLVNVTDGFHLWSERFDRELADVFAIQDEIARAIVDKLEVKLQGKEKGALVKRRAAYPEAYDIYLQARSLTLKMTDETYKKAEDLFKAGIEKWPDFALPLMGLTWLNILGTTWGKARPRDAYPKAKEYALRALELDGSLGDAYAASGFVRAFYDWDWTGAERDFKKALDLNPNSPDVHQSYASFLTCVKRHEEAVIEAKKARKLDPLSGAINSHSAQTFYYAGRTDEAVEILRETIILNPSIFLAHYVLGHIHSQRSMAQESLAEFEKAFELSGGYPLIATILIGVYNGLGRTAEAERIETGLRARAETEYVCPLSFFFLHLRREELGRAAECLENACNERDGFLPWVLVHPNPMNRIPDLPIFNDILKKHGLR